MAYLIVDKISRVRIMCHKVLPAVYDESLSYMEALSKLAYKLNETIEATNQLNDNVDVLNDSVLDLNTRVEAVENSVATFVAQMKEEFDRLAQEQDAKVDAKLSEVDVKLADVDAQMTAIDNRVTALEQGIDARLEAFKAEIDKAIEDLTKIVEDEIAIIQHLYSTFEQDMKDYVDEKLKEALDQIPDLTNVYVHDPTTGKLVTIQEAVNNIFIFHCYNGLTVKEWNALGLTVAQTNSIMVESIPRGMTVREWLHDAKKVLLEQLEDVKAKIIAYPHSFVRHYLTGNYVWHDKNVDLNQMLIASGGCFSVGEWNTLGFTVAEINAFNITCYDYIMRANAIMVRT